MEFVDRQMRNPNRVLISPESGPAFYAKLERADNPVVDGTPLNATVFNTMLDMIQSCLLYTSPSPRD